MMVAVTFQEKSKMPRRTGVGLHALSLVLTLSTAARASSDEPAGINLGGSSFMDGFGRTDPGFVYQQYFQIERYDAINDQIGHNLVAQSVKAWICWRLWAGVTLPAAWLKPDIRRRVPFGRRRSGGARTR